MAPKLEDRSLDATRRALYRRAVRQLRASLRQASAEQILSAVEAETPVGSIARLVSSAPGGTGTNADAWAEELMRGGEIKRELLNEAGGTFSAGEVGRLLGISPQAVQQRRMRDRLLAVPLANGEWGFPVCQFTPQGVPSALPRILAAFGSDNGWVRLSILLSREPALGDARLIDLVVQGERLDEVKALVASYGTQGAV